MEFPDDELVDFHDVLKRHGWNQGDFVLDWMPNPVPAGGIFPETGEVTISHKPSGVSRRYPCGHGQTWAFDFGRDLAEGVFR